MNVKFGRFTVCPGHFYIPPGPLGREGLRHSVWFWPYFSFSTDPNPERFFPNSNKLGISISPVLISLLYSNDDPSSSYQTKTESQIPAFQKDFCTYNYKSSIYLNTTTRKVNASKYLFPRIFWFLEVLLLPFHHMHH